MQRFVHTVSLGIACGLPCQVLQLSTLNNNDSGGKLNHDDDDDDDNDDDEEAEDDDDDDDEEDDYDDDDHDDHNDDYDEVMSFCSSDDVYPIRCAEDTAERHRKAGRFDL
jgi:hypothetical protein